MHECQSGRKVLHYSGPKLHRSPWRLSLCCSQGSSRVVAPDGLLNASLSAIGLFNEHWYVHCSTTGHRCGASRPTSSTTFGLLFWGSVYTPTSRPTPFTLESACQHAAGDAGRIWTQCDAIVRQPDLFVEATPLNFFSCWLALQPRNCLYLQASLVGWFESQFLTSYFFLLLDQFVGNSTAQKTAKLIWVVFTGRHTAQMGSMRWKEG